MSLPLCFSFALVAQALAALQSEGYLFIDSPPFSPLSYFTAIARNDISISSLTPFLVRQLLQSSAADEHWPRLLTVGGDVLSGDHVQAVLQRVPAMELFATYGLTQAGPRVTTLAAHAERSDRKFASVGLPITGTEVSLSNTSFRIFR